MIDFHVHLLPGVDDGSRNCKVSANMLKESVRQGVTLSVATPHFYFDKKTEKIIMRRDKAFASLEKFYNKRGFMFPDIRLGFEVFLSPEILEEQNLDSLLISGTNTLLLEMPFEKWEEDVFDRLDFLADKGYDIVLAHPERYAPVASEKDFDRLFSYGFAGQVNAASFINPRTRDFAYKLLEKGRIQVMGSDAHNTGTRAVFIEIAGEFISRRLGGKYLEMMQENAERLLCIK